MHFKYEDNATDNFFEWNIYLDEKWTSMDGK